MGKTGDILLSVTATPQDRRQPGGTGGICHMAINRREFEVLRDRVTKLENKLAALESRLKVQENKMSPKELYRLVKTEEKAREIEGQMGMTERPL